MKVRASIPSAEAFATPGAYTATRPPGFAQRRGPIRRFTTAVDEALHCAVMDRPSRRLALGPTDVLVERRADGAIGLRSPHPLGAYPQTLTERLEHWAARAPERTLFA